MNYRELLELSKKYPNCCQTNEQRTTMFEHRFRSIVVQQNQEKVAPDKEDNTENV